MTDLLYIKSKPTKYDDLEMRLSLRSVQKYGKNIGRVFVVGNKPDFCKFVEHIPCEDTYQPVQNHFVKVFKAIEKGISEDFLLMNDDFIMTTYFDASKYPFCHRGKLEKIKPANMYQEVIENTRQFLEDNGHTTFGYNVHCPILYNGSKFLKLKELADSVKKEKIGYDPRVLYGNMNQVSGYMVKDCKCYEDEMVKPVFGCVSLADNCDKLLNRFSNEFTDKSQWEK